MRESDTYQAIFDEGRQEGRQEGWQKGRREEAVRALWLVGLPRLGEPGAALRERVEGETDLAKIEEWLQRVAQIESWSELTR